METTTWVKLRHDLSTSLRHIMSQRVNYINLVYIGGHRVTLGRNIREGYRYPAQTCLITPSSSGFIFAWRGCSGKGLRLWVQEVPQIQGFRKVTVFDILVTAWLLELNWLECYTNMTRLGIDASIGWLYTLIYPCPPYRIIATVSGLLGVLCNKPGKVGCSLLNGRKLCVDMTSKAFEESYHTSPDCSSIP